MTTNATLEAAKVIGLLLVIIIGWIYLNDSFVDDNTHNACLKGNCSQCEFASNDEISCCSKQNALAQDFDTAIGYCSCAVDSAWKYDVCELETVVRLHRCDLCNIVDEMDRYYCEDHCKP